MSTSKEKVRSPNKKRQKSANVKSLHKKSAEQSAKEMVDDIGIFTLLKNEIWDTIFCVAHAITKPEWRLSKDQLELTGKVEELGIEWEARTVAGVWQPEVVYLDDTDEFRKEVALEYYSKLKPRPKSPAPTPNIRTIRKPPPNLFWVSIDGWRDEWKTTTDQKSAEVVVADQQ